MIINLIIVLILEILSIYTISISSKIPIINEIVCRMYLFFVIIWSVTLLEHISYYSKKMSKKLLKILEISILILGLIVCVFVPIEFTNSVPYAICGPVMNCIFTYMLLASIIEVLFIKLKIIELNDVSYVPYIVAWVLLLLAFLYQILSNTYMNLFSTFLTFVVVYQFYNTESQDSALLKNYEQIKVESDAKNKERDEFIANLSREIRTPMSNIVGFSNLIMLDQENMQLDVVKKDGIEIHKEAINLLSIINNILDLSRFEAGKEKKEESKKGKRFVCVQKNFF